MPSFRLIPSIDQLLLRPSLAPLAAQHGREAVANAARAAANDLRERLARGETGLPDAEAGALEWLERAVTRRLAERLAPSLRPVINATGVIVHTNLGRAPLAAEAREQASRIAAGYSNLEYDLAAGERGHRHVHAERLLCALTGADAALVANNNAAATLLVLAALASGREVIVSRGELVEIGGGFRVPDVMAQSGAVLREVGTTNRTRVSDYAAAIGDRTALLLRVHPSNFRIDGFTERPALADLVSLAHRFEQPVFEDLGSGWLGLDDPPPAALAGEPSVIESLRAGADLVAFSGDKLLGGPQAGLVVGRREPMERIRRHPLMRAVRADKITYAALEATLALWAQPGARVRIPVYRMLTLSVEEIERRAQAVVAALAPLKVLHTQLLDGASTTGGGSAPGSAIPTKLVTIEAAGLSPSRFDAVLRAQTPPIVARIHDDRVVLDLRTVAPDEDPALIAAIRAAAGSARA